MKLALSAALALVSLVAQQTTAPASPPDTHALAIVEALVAGDFGKVEAQYDAQMKAALPPGGLATSWRAGTATLGAFESITDIRTQTVGGYQVALVACRFSLYDVTIRVAFTAAGELGGLTTVNPVSRAVWRSPDYADATSFEERPITVRAGHWELPGFVTVPKAQGPHPAVALVHGSGPEDADETIGPNKVFKDLAEGLASRGVVVIRYEKRTHKYRLASSDDPSALTVKDEEMDDASAAVALLASMPEVNRARIFVLGHSEGGNIAPRIAAGDQAVKGIILLAGNVRSLDELIVEQVQYQAKLVGTMTPQAQQAIDQAKASAAEYANPDLKPGMTVHVLGSPLPASYVLDLRAYHPTEVAATLTIPILVLQGERDYQVTMTDFNLWQKALVGHANVTFKSYPALDHLFLAGSGPSTPAEYLVPGHLDKTVVADIAAWCAR